jgi:lipopolysaccharide transport system permease protein
MSISLSDLDDLFELPSIRRIVPFFSVTTGLLLTSMFSAIQFMETMRIPERSNRMPGFYWWIIPVSVALVVGLGDLLLHNYRFKHSAAYLLAVAVIGMAGRMTVTTPLLQLFWYVLISGVLGLFAFFIPELVLAGQRFDWKTHFEELKGSFYLIRIWTRNTIKAQYSENVLGIAWVMLMPLAQAGVMSFAFSVLLGRGEIDGKPFIVFLLSGIVVYNVFARTVQKSLNSIPAAMGVIKQIYFPREVILLTLMGEVLVDFAFSFMTLVVVSMFTNTYPNFYYLTLPLGLIVMLGMALGASLFVSFSSLVFRDLQQLVVLVLQLIFYVTVLFSLRIASPRVAVFGLANPLTVVVEFFRTVILYEQPPELAILLLPAVLAVVLVYSGYIFFKSNDDRLVDFS